MAFGFFISACLAAMFAFGGISPGTAGTARVVFLALLFCLAVSLVGGLTARKGGRTHGIDQR